MISKKMLYALFQQAQNSFESSTNNTRKVKWQIYFLFKRKEETQLIKPDDVPPEGSVLVNPLFKFMNFYTVQYTRHMGEIGENPI